MKLKFLALVLIACPLANAQVAAPTDRISMVFSGTDVSQVLKALSVRTGANVVYASSKDRIPVTMNVTVGSAEEAIRSVASAAGLVYRKVGKVYIVATSGGLRQALEPYGYNVSYTLPKGQAASVAARLQEALPYATVKALGDKVVMTAIIEDVQQANAFIKANSVTEEVEQTDSYVVVLRRITAAEITPLLKGLYPSLQISATEKSSDSSAGGSAGALGLVGTKVVLEAAKKTIEKLDADADSKGPNGAVYQIYTLRYMSATTISEFIRKAMPQVETLVGPEALSPSRGRFNPLSGASVSANAGSNGQNSGGTGGGQGAGGGANGGQAGGGQAGGSGGTTNDPLADFKYKTGDRAKAIIFKGTASAVAAAIKLAEQVDIKPMQVVVEARVIETSPTFSQQLGLTWDVSNNQTLQEGASGASGIGFGKFTRVTPLQFTAALQAKITAKEAKLLASPRIQAIDNDDAFIFVGDTIRSRIITNGNLGAQNVQIQEFPVGIILLFRPRINANGNITLHLNPVVSAVTGFGADNVPQTSSREAETTAIVKDGETIVIGGLIRDEYSRTISEVPFLAKIPILGELFRNRNTTKNRTDVIVTITVHIVKDAAEVQG